MFCRRLQCGQVFSIEKCMSKLKCTRIFPVPNSQAASGSAQKSRIVSQHVPQNALCFVHERKRIKHAFCIQGHARTNARTFYGILAFCIILKVIPLFSVSEKSGRVVPFPNLLVLLPTSVCVCEQSFYPVKSRFFAAYTKNKTFVCVCVFERE